MHGLLLLGLPLPMESSVSPQAWLFSSRVMVYLFLLFQLCWGWTLCMLGKLAALKQHPQPKKHCFQYHLHKGELPCWPRVSSSGLVGPTWVNFHLCVSVPPSSIPISLRAATSFKLLRPNT